MENLERYNNIFRKVFAISEDARLKTLKMEDNLNWDSVGHISLITELEDEFEVEFSFDDMADFRSYEDGIEIMKKLGVSL